MIRYDDMLDATGTSLVKAFLMDKITAARSKLGIIGMLEFNFPYPADPFDSEISLGDFVMSDSFIHFEYR